MLKLSIFIVIFLSLEAQKLSRTQVIMATFITITVNKEDKNLIEHGFKIMKDVDNSLSSYKKDAVVYRLNRDKQVVLDSYTYEALKLSKKYYKQTDGYFNIAVGSITKDLYHFGQKQELPTTIELSNSFVSYKTISFDKNTASLHRDAKIDFGGMGKGFGVDKVAGYFRANGVNADISASGDIRCLGICSVDVENPFSDKALASFNTLKENTGITTSGNYNRFVGSVKNNHLINPKLKKPQTKFISITLIGELRNSDLDAYATAASVMPMDNAYEFLDTLELCYIALQSDKELKVSSNISKYTSDLIINYTMQNKP